LAAVAGLGLEPVDQIDDVVEAPAAAGPDAASSDGKGEMGLSGAGAADQDSITLLSNEVAAGEVMDEGLIDRRVLEHEVVEILGKRQFGGGELISDRARLLLADLGFKQITNDALGLMLTFDGGGHDLIEGGLHAIELELAHEVEEFSAFHQMVLLRLS
jgi:hypothetical protein